MLPGDVTVEVRDENFERVGQLTDDDLADIIATPTMTDLGTWQVKLPHLVRMDSGRTVRHPLAQQLRTPGFGLIVTGPGGVLLSGPTSDVKLVVSPVDPNGTWTIQGVSDLQWAIEATAYGDPTTADLTAQAAANDTKTTAAESLLHWYVSRNRGPAAVSGRRNLRMTMGSDLARGPSLTKSPRFQKMLPLMLEIVRESFKSDGTRLNFDVVQVADELEFRVTESVDRSSLIRLDFESGALESGEYGYSAETLTDAIVAGQETGTARNMRRRTVTSAWGFHIEDFIDRRDTDDNAELDQAGDDALAKANDKMTSFSASFAADVGLIPGVDYSVGDIVTIVVPSPAGVDEEVTVPVAAVPLLVSADGVRAGIAVGSPFGSAWEDLVDARQSAFESRISRLERSV